MKLLLVILFLPTLSFANFLECSSIPYVFQGIKIAYIRDKYVFETKDKVLIIYDLTQCKIYKSIDDINKAHGWEKVK